MGLHLTCQRTVALLTDYAEETLGWSDRLRVSMHLRACPGCRTVLATTLSLGSMVLQEQRADGAAPDEARRALDFALAHLGAPASRKPARTAIPARLKDLLDRDPDRPLQLLALAHASVDSVVPRERHPLIPEEVMAELPPQAEWHWRNRGGTRVAEVLRDSVRGARLSLLFAPAGFRVPLHRHRGTESLLLLDGEMADDRGSYATGDWLYYEEGSLHSPQMGAEGCWCLVREEGDQHFEGTLGWLRNWLAA